MKKFLLLFALCGLFSFQAKAEGEVTDKITISELQNDEYGSFFTVSLEGCDIYYSALNIEIELPEGMSIPESEETNSGLDIWQCEDSPLFISGRKKASFDMAISFGAKGERVLAVVFASISGAQFLSTSGELFDVYVKSPYMKPGVSYLKTINVNGSDKAGVLSILPTDSYPITIGDSREISLNISATQQWNTCVLPFDAELPEGVRAFEGSSISGDYLILSEATSLQAFTPYILYAENGYEGTLSGTVDAEKYVTAATGAYLNGAIMPQEITEGYVMQDKGQGDGMMFYNVNNRSFTIPSGKCWVSAAAGDAKAIRIGLGGTGIESLPSASQTEEGEVYTLDGKRVQNPQKGNVYIKGGKKVLYLK